MFTDLTQSRMLYLTARLWPSCAQILMLIFPFCPPFDLPCLSSMACKTHVCFFSCRSMLQIHVESSTSVMIHHDGGFQPLRWSSQPHTHCSLTLMPCIKITPMMRSLAKVHIISPFPSKLHTGKWCPMTHALTMNCILSLCLLFRIDDLLAKDPPYVSVYECFP